MIKNPFGYFVDLVYQGKLEAHFVAALPNPIVSRAYSHVFNRAGILFPILYNCFAMPKYTKNANIKTASAKACGLELTNLSW